MADKLEAPCPRCGALNRINPKFAGRPMLCGTCGESFTAGPPPDAPPPAGSPAAPSAGTPAADPVRELVKHVHDVTLIAHYRHAGFTDPPLLDRMAQNFLEITAGFHGQGRGLVDGVRIGMGCIPLTLRARKGALFLCEPDFSRTNPFEERFLVPEITNTLRVSVMQDLMTDLTHQQSTECLCWQVMIVEKGALDHPSIAMVRSEPADEKDSGWSIGRLDPRKRLNLDDDPECEFIPVFRLLTRRPELIKAVILPPGTEVWFKGDTVMDVRDNWGNSVWPPEHRILPD